MKTAEKHGGDVQYGLGRQEGYRYGGCSAVLQRTAPDQPVQRNLRVLYVPQGFDSIDNGIVDALRQTAAETEVSKPAELIEKARDWKPDLVLVLNAMHVFPEDHPAHMDLLRSWGIRTAVWFADDPYFTEYSSNLAPHYDYVFTHELSCIPLYSSLGCSRVYYLPLAADLQLFSPARVPLQYQSDVCFIGNAFWNRVALFDELAEYLSTRKIVIAGAHWNRMRNYELLRPQIREGWVEPSETMLYYNGAKVVLNLHRPAEQGQDNHNTANLPGNSINPRTYEIAGCGSLQLTDVREDLTRYYRPGYDIETFNTAQELQKKIEYYLTHEQERNRIAWRGLWTTRQQHSYVNRINRLLAVVE
nr:DUF3880 domain-containing protein [Paenibacillus pinistramenti]